MEDQSMNSTSVAQTVLRCQLCNHHNVKWRCQECSIFMCNACKEEIHPTKKSADTHLVLSIKDIGKTQSYDTELWYYGKTSRLDAAKLLKNCKNMSDGTFLIRDSESSVGCYSLDLLVDGEAKHLKIKPLEISGQLKFYGSGQLFDGLQQLLAFYKVNPILKSRKGAKIRLTETVLPETRM